MSEFVKLRAADGHELGAYLALPAGEPIAALVVVQEIFGVNAHIRSVADGYAKDGFLCVAPALFDRIEPGIELGYEGEDVQTARSMVPKLDFAKAIEDIQAAVDYAAEASGANVGVVGYCLGGTLAWLSATRLRPTAVVGYYAGSIGKFAAEMPTCPVMLHFGREDTHIPASEVEKVTSAHPAVEVYWYDAGHAFNCEPRANYNAAAAKEARGRSVEFFKKQLA
jgi:carboxymethylenebutenolidase